MSSTPEFLWGTLNEVGARAQTETPAFRLVNPAGELPAAFLTFPVAVPASARAIVRNARAVASAWSDDAADWCFVAGLPPPDLSAPRGAQAAAIWPALVGVLEEAGLAFSDVVRTWLYVDRVCEWYGEFNAARSAFFDEHGVFEHFLPASTGIGTANQDGAALVAGAIAMRPKKPGVRAEIVESPLQAPAMAYKSSFSRAAEIFTSSRRTLFVSGTASIKPNSHDVAYVGDVERQIACTMTAVEAILSSRAMAWADVRYAIVYLKKPEFRAAWRAWLAAHGLPADFAAETVCDVCRDEWLFEIELGAEKLLVS